MDHWGYTLLTWLSLPIVLTTVQTDWKPIKSRTDFSLGPRIAYLASPSRHRKQPILDSCSLYKAVMDQHNFHQYIQYKHHIPELIEFTLCAWHKFYNHSSSHPIFSYALPHKAKAILSWISNTAKQSYYMLAINGHTIYRLNFPMKLNKWYHMCQSWNGKTGEWQLWVNNERIGRGYYNLMVGKPIKSGGIAITGQEQMDHEDGLEIKGIDSGLQGEITLLQLYKAALTVGKAYNDHRHHHVHVFTHDGGYDDEENNVSPPDGSSNEEEMPNDAAAHGLASEADHPHFENGQLKHILPVHELLAKPPVKPAVYANPNYGRFPPAGLSSLSKVPHLLRGKVHAPHNFKFLKHSDILIPAPVPLDFEIVGKRIEIRPKRQSNSSHQTDWVPMQPAIVALPTPVAALRAASLTANVSSANVDDTGLALRTKSFEDKSAGNRRQRHRVTGDDNSQDKAQQKRAIIIREHILPPLEFHSDTGISNLYSHLDGHDIPDDDFFTLFKQQQSSDGDKPPKPQYEPAEWEVRKISEVCTGCQDDSFKKANVLSWQETPKKLFAGAQYVPAVPKCYLF